MTYLKDKKEIINTHNLSFWLNTKFQKKILNKGGRGAGVQPNSDIADKRGKGGRRSSIC